MFLYIVFCDKNCLGDGDTSFQHQDIFSGFCVPALPVMLSRILLFNQPDRLWYYCTVTDSQLAAGEDASAPGDECDDDSENSDGDDFVTVSEMFLVPSDMFVAASDDGGDTSATIVLSKLLATNDEIYSSTEYTWLLDMVNYTLQVINNTQRFWH